MTFTERINLDIKNAMLAKEKEKLAALRDIKSKLLLEATSGADAEVSEESAMKICMKLHKQRMETYALYNEQARPDLAAEELYQAQVIEAYLPKMLTEDEMRDWIGVDSLKFISLDGLYRAAGEAAGRNPAAPKFCDACFSGEYPITPSDKISEGFEMKAAE